MNQKILAASVLVMMLHHDTKNNVDIIVTHFSNGEDRSNPIGLFMNKVFEDGLTHFSFTWVEMMF